MHEQRKRDQQPPIPLIEWLAAGLGVAIVVTTVISLMVAATREQTPPDIILSVDTVTSTRTAYVVEVRAHNRGTEAAAQVTIEGVVLARADAPEERSYVTIDYLPGHSVRTAGLIFRTDPRSERLELRAIGYHEP